MIILFALLFVLFYYKPKLKSFLLNMLLIIIFLLYTISVNVSIMTLVLLPQMMSRIPVPSTSYHLNGKQSLTRLEQLRLNFQAKLMFENQRQLVHIYREQQQERVQVKHESVRALFQQRRRGVGRDKSYPLAPVNYKAHSAPYDLNSRKSKLPKINSKPPIRPHSRSNSMPENEPVQKVRSKYNSVKKAQPLHRSNSLSSVTDKKSIRQLAPSPPSLPKSNHQFGDWQKQQDSERLERLKRHRHHEQIDQTFSPIPSNRTESPEVEIMSTRDFEAEVKIKEQQLLKLLQSTQEDRTRRTPETTRDERMRMETNHKIEEEVKQ